MSLLNSTIKRVAHTQGYDIVRSRSAEQHAWDALMSVKGLAHAPSGDFWEFAQLCRENVGRSQAQLYQDVFVLWVLKQKRDGFFVEFGAADGVMLSNTHLLETGFGWRGILAEPARTWIEPLRANRRCIIDTRCVTAVSGETVSFNEAESPELSTMEAFSDSDHHAQDRVSGQRYEVETVSLMDLLTGHGAPKDVDYLSVDTEGSEFLILDSLDFDRFLPRVITVEHNHAPEKRNAIFNLLSRHGYRRWFAEQSDFDDWYVLA